MTRTYNKLSILGAVFFGGLVAMGCSDGGSATTTGNTGGSGGSGGEGQGGSGGNGNGGAGGGATTCKAGETRDCYTGATGTEGVGICKKGTETCNADGTAFGMCEGEVVPGVETCATMEDDDCDGMVNEDGEGCVCVPGSSSACYTGPMGTEGVGICAAGTQICKTDGTGYEACTGDVLPGVETCMTLEDDDCDGMINEDGAGCVCVPGTTEPCYSGPAATAGVGVCMAGTHTCSADGTAYDACAGEVLPSVETCMTLVDDDCDGMVNEDGAGCICVPGSTMPCYSGPMGTAGVGVCAMGVQTCNAAGTAYDMCMGEVLPGTETCMTPVDDDCDGMVNESGTGCICLPNGMSPCYSGPMGTQGVGICKAGAQACNDQGTMLGVCVGEVIPLMMENCATPEDDNCDGQANEGCCTPVPNVVADGSYEAGPGGGAWMESSTNFGTPLCDVGSCGVGSGTGPSNGAVWAWFGGIGNYEEGSTSQTVTIPAGAGGTVSLTFQLETPVCDSADDYIEVLIDGTSVFSVDGSAASCGVVGYALQTVDLAAYADGMSHTLSFHSEIFATNGGGSNFFVDDVKLVKTCP